MNEALKLLAQIARNLHERTDHYGTAESARTREALAELDELLELAPACVHCGAVTACSVDECGSYATCLNPKCGAHMSAPRSR